MESHHTEEITRLGVAVRNAGESYSNLQKAYTAKETTFDELLNAEALFNSLARELNIARAKKVLCEAKEKCTLAWEKLQKIKKEAMYIDETYDADEYYNSADCCVERAIHALKRAERPCVSVLLLPEEQEIMS